MTKRDIELAKKFKLFVSKKIQILDIKVFGSRARGDAENGSDLDIFLVVDGLNQDKERYIDDCAWEVGFKEGIVIFPLTIDSINLKKRAAQGSIFIKNVYREGIDV